MLRRHSRHDITPCVLIVTELLLLSPETRGKRSHTLGFSPASTFVYALWRSLKIPHHAKHLPPKQSAIKAVTLHHLWSGSPWAEHGVCASRSRHWKSSNCFRGIPSSGNAFSACLCFPCICTRLLFFFHYYVLHKQRMSTQISFGTCSNLKKKKNKNKMLVATSAGSRDETSSSSWLMCYYRYIYKCCMSELRKLWGFNYGRWLLVSPPRMKNTLMPSDDFLGNELRLNQRFDYSARKELHNQPGEVTWWEWFNY